MLLFKNKIDMEVDLMCFFVQIKVADGDWIAADPIPNSILVNTGDLLEVWTNKFYPATVNFLFVF